MSFSLGYHWRRGFSWLYQCLLPSKESDSDKPDDSVNVDVDATSQHLQHHRLLLSPPAISEDKSSVWSVTSSCSHHLPICYTSQACKNSGMNHSYSPICTLMLITFYPNIFPISKINPEQYWRDKKRCCNVWVFSWTQHTPRWFQSFWLFLLLFLWYLHNTVFLHQQTSKSRWLLDLKYLQMIFRCTIDNCNTNNNGNCHCNGQETPYDVEHRPQVLILIVSCINHHETSSEPHPTTQKNNFHNIFLKNVIKNS